MTPLFRRLSADLRDTVALGGARLRAFFAFLAHIRALIDQFSADLDRLHAIYGTGNPPQPPAASLAEPPAPPQALTSASAPGPRRASPRAPGHAPLTDTPGSLGALDLALAPGAKPAAPAAPAPVRAAAPRSRVPGPCRIPARAPHPPSIHARAPLNRALRPRPAPRRKNRLLPAAPSHAYNVTLT